MNLEKTLSIALALILLSSCKIPAPSSDHTDAMLSEKSSQKCGLIKEDLEGSYMLIPSESPIYFKPQNEASLRKLKSLQETEVCIIADFSEAPVSLTFEHLIQPKNQTLCGEMTQQNETFYFKPKEDLITYEISTGNEQVSNWFKTQLDKPICMTADFRGQEVQVTSLNQLSEAQP